MNLQTSPLGLNVRIENYCRTPPP